MVQMNWLDQIKVFKLYFMLNKCIMGTTMVLITFLPLPSLSHSTFPSAACLRSCSTCKQMYGGNFRGHLCATGCLESRGSSWRPVCTDLPSIRSFLDLSSLTNFRWSDEVS